MKSRNAVDSEKVKDLRAYIHDNFKMSNEELLSLYYTSELNIFNKMAAHMTFKDTIIDLKAYLKKNRDFKTFNTLLDQFRSEKQTTNIEIYTKATIDRKLFSKIISNRYYHPSKKTIIAIGIAMELSQEEMDKLLLSCGYILSKNIIFDLVIRYCIERKIYNVLDINGLLFEVKQDSLTK